MARVQIDLPARFSFSTDIQIYINHINYGNHLDNSAMLALISEARVRFFKALNYSELDVEGLGIIVADVAAQYKSEAFHGEIMRIEMVAGEFNKYGCDLLWRMSDQASGREVSRGKHGIMFFDYGLRKAAQVPPAFIAKASA